MSLQSFAHLLGLSGRAARGKKRGARAENELPTVDDRNNDDPLDEQYAEEDEDDKPKGRKAKRAEDDDDGAGAEEDDDKPKGRRAKRAEDGDDGDDAEEDEDDKPSAAAARERSRCAHIMAHGIKHGMAEQAFVAAFDTNMSRGAAINFLNTTRAVTPKQGNAGAFQMAMSQLGVTHVKPDAARKAPAGADAAAQMIINAGKAAQ